MSLLLLLPDSTEPGPGSGLSYDDAVGGGLGHGHCHAHRLHATAVQASHRPLYQGLISARTIILAKTAGEQALSWIRYDFSPDPDPTF
jgi:hypothetical protein